MRTLFVREGQFSKDVAYTLLWKESLRYPESCWRPVVVEDVTTMLLCCLQENAEEDREAIIRFVDEAFGEMVRGGCYKRIPKGQWLGNYECVTPPGPELSEAPQLELSFESAEHGAFEPNESAPKPIPIHSAAPRIQVMVSRIVRDTPTAAALKDLYEGRCQVCGLTLHVGDKSYCEVHHLRPLGSPHDGPDISSNMMVLCPNHHVLFDYGVPAWRNNERIEIEGIEFSVELRHFIDRIFIDYYQSFCKFKISHAQNV